ncbi:hypothetical protein ABLO26_25600 [Neobacillus sp. 179-J 1A1 HS]|uniref:hypothetical protein n=1 Tax=Neobacillus driksii TaxID=3035913 RepID=UPI0035BC78D7
MKQDNINDRSKESNKLHYMISLGAEMAGGAAGAALGMITGGPGLAVLMGAAGNGISKVLIDSTEKFLSNREKARTGAAVACAVTKVSNRLNDGITLRQDDFFDERLDGRSKNEELLEGILLNSSNEHEEKKVKLLSNIYSNTIFMNSISLGEANHILKIAGNLTYRQLCVLSLAVRKTEITNICLSKKYLSDNEHLINDVPVESISLRQEILDMYRQGLISSKVLEENNTGFASPRIELEDGNLVMNTWYDVVPDGINLTPLGKLCYELMDLEEIPTDDMFEVAIILQI